MKRNMKLFAFSTVFAFALILTVPRSEAANDDSHFNNITSALKYFLQTPSLLDHVGEVDHGYQDYSYLLQLALADYLNRPDSPWRIYRMGNFDMFGNAIPVGFVDLPINNQGEIRRIAVAAHYFIYKGDLSGPRLVVVGSPQFECFASGGCRTYDRLEVYPQKGGEAIADEFRNSILEYLNARNFYRHGVLEISFDGKLQFLSNMDKIGRLEWDDLILDETTKRSSFNQSEGYLQLVDFFERSRIKSKKGVLLYGPPGTGKSLLGQILISSLLSGTLKDKATLISLTARNLVYKHTVQSLFKEAARLAPTVIFIEDIDLLGISNRGEWGADTKEDMLNEFLNGIDGGIDIDKVLVIATTNKPESVDKALIRSGRLGSHILFGLPAFQERKAFFERFGKKKASWEEAVTVEWLAGETEGLNGADIIEIIRLAKEQAFKENSWDGPRLRILRGHFVIAINRVRNDGPPSWLGGVFPKDLGREKPVSLKESLNQLHEFESAQ